MSAESFLDTNVLVYATAKDDPRAPIATALLSDGGTISAQVLNEFANVASRKLGWSWPEIRASAAAFQVLCPKVVPLSLASHAAALELAQNERFTFYDALIVAAAMEASCTTLLTEDMQDGRVIAGRLTIRNPFASA